MRLAVRAGPVRPPRGGNGFYVLREDGAVAGTLGSLRQPLWLDGRPIEATWLSELLVDPAFRGRGLAQQLLDHVRGTSELTLLLGMTDVASRLYDKLGYREIGWLSPSFRIRDPAAFLRDVRAHRGGDAPHGDDPRRRSLLGRLASIPLRSAWRVAGRLAGRSRGVRVGASRPPVDELDQLWARTAATHRAFAARPGAFVRWRFWECPLARYAEHYAWRGETLVGFAFAKRYRTDGGVRIGVVSELYVERGDDGALLALLAEATRRLERDGVDYVKAAFSDPWARSLASRLGYLDPARLSARYREIGPRFLATGPAEERVPLIDGWWLTRGDSEQDLMDARPEQLL